MGKSHFCLRSIGITEGNLYFHVFFLNVGSNLLPVTTYYMVANGVVVQVDPVSFELTPTGDSISELVNCKDLGVFAQGKVREYDLGYIDAKKLTDVLANMNEIG